MGDIVHSLLSAYGEIMQFLFKICTITEWTMAEAAGVFTGAPLDHADGFIHLSAGHQVRETARRHFAEGQNLVLVAFADGDLTGLKWEASRGGDLFPHVYGAIPVGAARWVQPLPLQAGAHVFPGGIPQ